MLRSGRRKMAETSDVDEGLKGGGRNRGDVEEGKRRACVYVCLCNVYVCASVCVCARERVCV